MDRLLPTSEAAQILGVSITTLRRWEAEGKLVPEHTTGKHRRYDIYKLKPELFPVITNKKRTIAYARVSSHDQKNDLERQKKVLELYCAQHGWTFEIITDLGSGMNYYKKGLKKLLNHILKYQIERLIITHKDRLLRFGAELVFAICEAKNAVAIKDRQIQLPVVGWVRMHEALRLDGQIKSVTVSRTADRWFASIQVEIPDPPKSENQGTAVGVDLGIKTLATLSNGEFIEGPKALRKSLWNLRHESRSLSRKKKGSFNRMK